MSDVFRGLGVEVELPDDGSFLKVVETLTRIGVASKREKKLTQTCHILHKRGRYAILHFKELFILDGKTSDIIPDDLFRRNRIASLLQEWGLVRVMRPEFESDPKTSMSMSMIKVVSFREKLEWVLTSKYTVGVRRPES